MPVIKQLCGMDTISNRAFTGGSLFLSLVLEEI